MTNNENFSYAEISKQGTGSREEHVDYKIIVYPFDKFLISVKLTPDGRFIGIVQVQVNKEFLSYQQKTTPKGFHDVDELYRE